MSMMTNDSPSESAGDPSPSTAVLEAVSASSGVPATDLPPLYDAIDPGALEALFAGRRTSGHVEFRYAGHVVTVDADRTVEVSTDR
ncbi:MAG: HalOD1 output domain-containing protein [Haloferacaceae archaeon]